VISPILSNIYLDRLDKYVETELLPAYNRGKIRKVNPEYIAVRNKLRKAKAHDDKEMIRELLQARRTIPSRKPDDPDYRRLKYIRYADDFLLGFVGPKAEAQEIKEKLGHYLRDKLKLEMSEDKTLITHAQKETARFLGYELKTMTADDKLDHQGRRSVNRRITLRVPKDVVNAHVAKRLTNGQPAHRKELTILDDYTIVRTYQAEYRGLVNYYLMASNVATLSKYHWVMQVSVLKTLANKHKTTVTKIAKKLRATTQTAYGPRAVYRVIKPRKRKEPLVAEFGGIPLCKQEVKVLHDTSYRIWTKRSDPVTRLLKQKCEMCGRTADEMEYLGTQLGRIEAHHIRKLANLQRKGRREPPDWVKTMMAIRRKTLIVCTECHDNIHAGRPCRPHADEESRDIVSGEPDDAKVSRPVRRGADGKGA
jgi:hypothetical protein